MEILEVTYKEFSQVIFDPFYIFGKADFNQMNCIKSEKVYYLLFKESKYRLGLIGGVKKEVFYSPFSAPFGGFLYVTGSVGIEYLDHAIDALINWAKAKKLESVVLTLPPPIYNETFISRQINSLYRKNFSLQSIDLNFSFNTEKIKKDYFQNIQKNARNNLKKALNNNLTFFRCGEMEEKKTAYDIIKQHKKIKGYPLKMTWKQILETIKIIDADFFLVYNAEKIPIASAIVFHTAQTIVQIIYWGDLLEYLPLRTMNYMSYKLFHYYSERNYEFIDLGPSSENSVPNIGLCDFKESIGCDISQKMTFQYNIIHADIHPSSDVQTHKIGENTVVWQNCVILPNAQIGKNCNINCGVFIENDVVVGNNVTVKSGVQLWDAIELEDNVFIGPNATLTNDLIPRSKQNISPFLKTLIKKGASVGANATILPGLTIGKYAMIGAGAVVTKNVGNYEIWIGNPARHAGYADEKGNVLDMNFISRKTGEKYMLIHQNLVNMSHPLLATKDVSLKLIEIQDAELILKLRTHPDLEKNISPTAPSLKLQIEWIEKYKIREKNQQEFYFIFSDSNHKPWGTIRLYDFTNTSFTIGSWLCLPGNTEKTAIKAWLLAIEFGYEKLNFKSCNFDIRKWNKSVLYFAYLFKPELTDEDKLNYYFSLDREAFFAHRNKVIKFIELK